MRKPHVLRPLLACCLLLTAVLAGSMARAADGSAWLGPELVVASADGKVLYVSCLDARLIQVVDPATGQVAKAWPMPGVPTGMALSADGAKLYVTCGGPQSTIQILDTASGQTVATLPAGHTARGPALTPDGKRLYVCNRFNNCVAVFDLDAGKDVAHVPTIREPYDAVVTPDGKTAFVADHLPLDVSDGYDVAAHVTAIDVASGQTSDIRLLNGSSGLRDICVSPDGKYVFVAHVLARYQMPTTQLERGWMNTNALTIIDAAEKKLVNTVLLDDVDLGAANPWGVTVSPDGKWICVAHAGTKEMSVIDSAKLLEKVLGMPKTIEEAKAQGRYDTTGLYASIVAADVPNDLAYLVDLRKRVPLEGEGARGVAVAGGKAFAAMYFSDKLGVVDLTAEPPRRSGTLALGPDPVMTVQRRGEMLFNSADLCFQHWQSCGSCHPDARIDGFNWDLMNDGLGNPKNVKNMLLAHQTPPSMASGVRSGGEEAVRAGIRHIQFAVRPEEDSLAIDEYLKALQPVPSPYLVGGQLSESAQRGKALFESEQVGCVKCHPAPLYTDLQMHDVKSRGRFDRRDDFDTPTLIEVWRTAPYMHDGHWVTIQQLFTEGKHGHKGLEGLSEQQFNDLVEFVLSL